MISKLLFQAVMTLCRQNIRKFCPRSQLVVPPIHLKNKCLKLLKNDFEAMVFFVTWTRSNLPPQSVTFVTKNVFFLKASLTGFWFNVLLNNIITHPHNNYILTPWAPVGAKNNAPNNCLVTALMPTCVLKHGESTPPLAKLRILSP